MTDPPVDEPDRPTPVSVGDDQLGKTRLLAAQCSTCIFRPRNPMRLAPGRLRELVSEAIDRDSFIVCHATLPAMANGMEPAICRGFTDRYSTTALQLIARLWGFVEVDPPEHSPER